MIVNNVKYSHVRLYEYSYSNNSAALEVER